MSWRTIPLLFFLAVAVFCMACGENPECDQELPYDSLIVKFYSSETFDTMSVSYDYVSATGGDSLLYNSKELALQFTFPLNPSMSSVTYNFIKGVRIDSLELFYTRELLWLSEECGPNMKFSGLSLGQHSFDSVRILKTAFDNSINENIRIYN